jgi:hypothetical protein
LAALLASRFARAARSSMEIGERATSTQLIADDSELLGIAIVGLVLGWLCYSIASNMLTYMDTAPEERR